MADKRKMTCECGGHLEKKIVEFDSVKTEAMVCPKCSFITLIKEQAQKYVKLKQLHSILDAERRIIKIGNSMGLTLPDQLQEFGVKVGKKVRIEALTPSSFKVEMK